MQQAQLNHDKQFTRHVYSSTSRRKTHETTTCAYGMRRPTYMIGPSLYISHDMVKVVGQQHQAIRIYQDSSVRSCSTRIIVCSRQRDLLMSLESCNFFAIRQTQLRRGYCGCCRRRCSRRRGRGFLGHHERRLIFRLSCNSARDRKGSDDLTKMAFFSPRVDC
jgi:hypothetical protein